MHGARLIAKLAAPGALRKSTAAAAAVLCLICAAQAAADSPLEQVEQKAYFWMQRGRADKAAELWRKLLRSFPAHADALAELAVHDAAAGRMQRAALGLEMLEAASPGDPRLDCLHAIIGLRAEFAAGLQRARTLSESKKLSEAVDEYRRAFGGVAPTVLVGLELYQVLAALPDGWEEARVGLEQLAKIYPRAPHVQLSLGLHWSYRPRTRIAGIQLLARLADDDRLGGAALRGWRQALLWLDVERRGVGMLRAYLELHPEDAEIRERLTGLQKERQTRSATKAGFEALAKKRLGAAERLFRGSLESREQAEALVGLAVVALEKNQFADARELLERAKKLAPHKPELWRESLESARFWALFEEGQRQLAAEHLRRAEQLFLDAAKESGREWPHAALALGHLYLRQNLLDAAETQLRRVLTAYPDNPAALRALVDLLMRSKRGDEAVALNERLRAVDAQRAYPSHVLKAESMRLRSLELLEQERLLAAQQLLVQANRTDPANAWALLDLANLQLQLGMVDEAKLGIERLLKREPGHHEALLAKARVCEVEGEYALGLSIIQRMSPDALGDGARRLLSRLQLREEIELALRWFGEGEVVASRHEMDRLARQSEDDPELSGIVALGWSRMGDHERAERLLREQLGTASDAAAQLQVQLATVLLEAGAEGRFLKTIAELRRQPSLSFQQRRAVARLRIAYAVRKADALLEKDDPSEALAQLRPMAAQYPNDLVLAAALGRVLQRAGEYARAEAAFRTVLAAQPDDIEALHGVALACVARGDYSTATDALQQALQWAPEDARLHLLAARLARLRHDVPSARLALNRARTLAAADELVQRSTALAGEQTRDEALREEIEDELDTLLHESAVSLRAQTQVRSRSGRAGLEALWELSLPLELEAPLSSGAFHLELRPVHVSSGNVNPLSAPLLGAGALGGERLTDDVKTGFAGVGLGVGYSSQDLRLEIGTTPLGFTHNNIIGGLSWQRSFSVLDFTLRAARKPVLDSVLSYAGLTDAVTGKSWGSVVRQGGEATLHYGTRELSCHLFARYDLLTGVRVANNHRVEGGTGVQWLLLDRSFGKIRAGVGGSTLTFEKNLSQMTFGHGGYFSPQQFVHLGAPLSWQGKEGRLQWSLSAEPGVNWFYVEEQHYYPERRWLQEQSIAMHEAQTSSGPAFNGSLRLSYRIARDVTAGARAGAHTGEDYRELHAGAFISYWVEESEG